MFSLFYDVAQEIALLPTKHSWVGYLMLLPYEEREAVRDKIDNWIEVNIKKLFPESCDADRIVRDVYDLFLERYAIIEWNNIRCRSFPITVFTDAGSAAYAGAADLMYVQYQDIEYATKFLEILDEGGLVPDLESCGYELKSYDDVICFLQHEDKFQFDILDLRNKLKPAIQKLALSLITPDCCSFQDWFAAIYSLLEPISSDPSYFYSCIYELWNSDLLEQSKQVAKEEREMYYGVEFEEDRIEFLVENANILSDLCFFENHTERMLGRDDIDDYDVELGYIDEPRKSMRDKVVFDLDDNEIGVEDWCLYMTSPIEVLYSTHSTQISFNIYELIDKLKRNNKRLLYFVEDRFFGFTVYDAVTKLELFNIQAFSVKDILKRKNKSLNKRIINPQKEIKIDPCDFVPNPIKLVVMEYDAFRESIIKLAPLCVQRKNGIEAGIWFQIKGDKCIAYVANAYNIRKLILNNKVRYGDVDDIIFNQIQSEVVEFMISPNMIDDLSDVYVDENNNIIIELHPGMARIIGNGQYCNYSSFYDDAIVKESMLSRVDKLLEVSDINTSIAVKLIDFIPVVNRMVAFCPSSHCVNISYKDNVLYLNSRDDLNRSSVNEHIDVVGYGDVFSCDLLLRSFCNIVNSIHKNENAMIMHKILPNNKKVILISVKDDLCYMREK